MQLPGEVRDFLNIVGFTWPAADETKLLELGQIWTSLSGRIDSHVADAQFAAAAVWSGNTAPMVDSFQAKWTGDSSPANRITDGATGADIIGAGVMVCAGIVLALKINVIVQVTIAIISIASAIAAAFVTFGASAAVVPLIREACKRLLDYLLGEAVAKVISG
jgi:hypothetical protein